MLVGERVERATYCTAAWDRGVGDTLAAIVVDAKRVFEGVGFGRGELDGAGVEGFGCAGACEGNGRCGGDSGALKWALEWLLLVMGKGRRGGTYGWTSVVEVIGVCRRCDGEAGAGAADARGGWVREEIGREEIRCILGGICDGC